MTQLIIDNQDFIYYLFNVTAGGLVALSLITGLSYQFWNIIIWFGIIPGIWLYMISKRTSPWINIISLCLVLYLSIVATWNKWFNEAVDLLNYLCSVFGPDYRQMSVYICLFLPLIITAILGHLFLGKHQIKIYGSILLATIVLITIFFPISNKLLGNPKYSGYLESYNSEYQSNLKRLSN